MGTDKRRNYGSGSIYQRASDGRFVGTIEAGWTRTGSRRRITVTAKTRAEVNRKLRDKRLAIENAGQVKGGRATVKSWAQEWLKITAKTSRPKTHTTDLAAVNAWIIPTIGHKRLDGLTPADIRAVSDAIRAAGHATSTALRYHGTLQRILRAAILEGHNVPSRVLAVDAPTANATDRTALSVPHALAVLAVASTLPHGSRWAMALLQGMRQGECLGLTWECVDLDRLTVSVSWQLQALPYIDATHKELGFRIPDGYEARHLEAAVHLVRPKSTKSRRVIPLLPWMRDALVKWQAIAPESPHGLVWPGVDGSPAQTRADTREWEALQATAEIGHPAGRYYKGHEARNTTATLLLEAGVDESVRLAIMGHSKITTTRGYEYVDVELLRAALGKVATRLQLDGHPSQG